MNSRFGLFGSLTAALGIEGARKAESRELQKIARGLENMRKERAHNILQHEVIAQERGDQAGIQYWAGQANAYAAEHPGLESPTMGLPEALRRQMNQRIAAAGMHLPLGVNPHGFGLARALDWGKFAR